MNWNDFAKEIHANAVAHGWWDEPRTFGEIVALCHSELSEALEEVRARRPMVYADDFEGECRIMERSDIRMRGLKPEGIAVELADCIIRILDWLGREELDGNALLAEAGRCVMCDVPARVYAASIGDRIARWHLLLSLAYSCWCRASGPYAAALRMALCVHEIMEWAEEDGVDMEEILELKHAYNKGRPYRHGGKAL